jgi:hypothetical protein
VEPIAVIARAAAAALAGELELHVGDEVVAGVASAAGPDGRGVLALAGALHPARLPAGLREGQKLRLRVAGAEEGALLLRLAHEPGDPGGLAPARAAGALALRGDGLLLQAALALAGPAGALALPDGSAARVTVDEEPAEGGGAGSGPATATVLLHSPGLGAIEVRLRLDPAGISAAVEVEPAAAGAAERAAPELARALERAVSRPAAVAVSARAEDSKRPDPPRPEGVFDAYA